MSLERFFDRAAGRSRSLVVVNRTAPEPLQRLLDRLFAEQSITVEERVSDQYDEDTVLLVEDEEVVATSPLEALENAILLVNSDLFRTGARGLQETTVPAVMEGLTDHLFTLRGYPESNKEKLLLILVSRRIEQLAYSYGVGTLRSSFQRLSRLEKEQGTREAYDTVAGTDVDVHIYGQPDWVPSPEFGVTIHGGYKEDFRRSWFVLYNPPAVKRDRYDSAVLVAVEQDPGVWRAFWTYRREVVEDVGAYIRRTL
ncbi:MAG: hypothetical protein J07HX64_02317 [halophilic archaeon J07HX64]|nr:MAG: hypothetical protein J07HX64_02317 [halophilic archaeon J07HX64]